MSFVSKVTVLRIDSRFGEVFPTGAIVIVRRTFFA
jgi:hypothetical protein